MLKDMLRKSWGVARAWGEGSIAAVDVEMRRERVVRMVKCMVATDTVLPILQIKVWEIGTELDLCSIQRPNQFVHQNHGPTATTNRTTPIRHAIASSLA